MIKMKKKYFIIDQGQFESRFNLCVEYFQFDYYFIIIIMIITVGKDRKFLLLVFFLQKFIIFTLT